MSQLREQDIFEACLARPVEARAAYLKESCSDDPRMLERIERLLQAHQRAEARTDEMSPVLMPHLEDPEEIGPFKVLERLGEGGMGVVYLAEQTTPFHRRVALKLIKVGLDTREVMARFDSERQALALMNHPNIARILDAGATERGRPFFVMEYVRGTPLVEYCDSRRLTVEARLMLFGKVCSAVRHAHQKGVIHRDLKPTNILVTEEDGEAVPKVIDFGVAKATNQRLTEMTVYTELGRIIGTLEYMSPEQANLSSLDVDTRADVYSLGVLLYELLAGTRPFEFKDTDRNYAEIQRMLSEDEPDPPSQRVRKVVEFVPSIARNRSTTASSLIRKITGELEWITLKAMAKDPRKRYQGVQELSEDIDNFLAQRPLHAGPPNRLYKIRKMARRHLFALAAGVAGLVATVAVLTLLLGSTGWLGPAVEEGPVVRSSLIIGPDLELWEGASRPITLSPSGDRVAFSAVPSRAEGTTPDLRSRLYVRTLEEFTPRPLRGSEEARTPVFSPDGQWIAFFKEGWLSKMPADGGVVERITRAGLSPRGASWSTAGKIVYSLDSTPGLLIVDAAGGSPETIWEPDAEAGEIEYMWPEWLPDGSRLLATLRHDANGSRTNAVVLLDLESGTRTVLRDDAQQASYVPPGHIVYVHRGNLESMRFDPGASAVTGTPKQVIDALWVYPQGAAYYAVADSGSLIYAPAPSPGDVTLEQLPQGSGAIELPAGIPGWPRVAPDGRLAAVHIAAPDGRDVWILDLDRPGSMRQLTFDGGGFPTWSADGKRIAFMSRRGGSGDIYVVNADGSGQPRRVVTGSRTQIPVSWSSQGVLAYYEIGESTQRDIWVVDLEAGTEPEPFVGTPANEFSPVFSPDGRWIAYVSNETGQDEVYVRGFPPPGPVITISIAGGTEPVWNAGGRELLYRRRNTIMGVRFEEGGAEPLAPTAPIELFETTMTRNPGNPSYSVLPDGQSFLMLRTEGATSAQQLQLIWNWKAELTPRDARED